MVDPTWSNTTGGVDYFYTLDFDHFAFVIKGADSTYPVPAGGYKISDNGSKDVNVELSDVFPDQTQTLTLSTDFADSYFSALAPQGNILIRNSGSIVSPPEEITVTASFLKPVFQKISFGEIPPYGFIKYNPFDTAFVYANGINNINISTNGGYNFSVLPVKWMKGIIFSPKDSVIYGYNDYKLYKTYNKGLSWDSAQSVVKFSSLEVNPDLSNILYGGDSNGIYISTNYGSNWSLYNNSFSPSKVIIGISKDPGSADTFYAATTKNVYKIWASFLVGVQNGNSIIPEKFSLSQNYPNPFNPRTVIRFQLSVVGTNRQRTTNNVQLIVFDITGKEITTLVNEQLQPGTYEVPFSINQFSNIQNASGIYFYQLRTDNYTETKKMILTK